MDGVPAPIALVNVREVLPILGFVPARGVAMTEQEPSYRFRAPGLDMTVSQVTGRYLRRELLVTGLATWRHSRRQIQATMPLTVESDEQVAAWLAYAVGGDFVPVAPIAWLDWGRKCSDTLPWEKQRRQLVEFERSRRLRPHCTVERDDLRAMIKKAAMLAGWPPAPDPFDIWFDGEVLVLRARGRVLVAAASGPAWDQPYRAPLPALHALARRRLPDPVVVGIWAGNLEVGRFLLPMA